MASFGAAFKAARKSGKKVFSWNGKSYNTKLASDTPKSAPKPTPRPSTSDKEKDRSVSKQAPRPTPKPNQKAMAAAEALGKATAAKKSPDTGVKGKPVVGSSRPVIDLGGLAPKKRTAQRGRNGLTIKK